MGNSLWASRDVLNSHRLFVVLRQALLAGIPTPYVAEAGLELLDFVPSRC